MAKEQRLMKKIPLTDEWYLGTDGISLVLFKRREIKAGRQTKPENVGGERYEAMGYYSSLRGVISGLQRYLAVETMMRTDADNLTEFIKELKERIDRVGRIEDELLDQLVSNLGVNT